MRVHAARSVSEIEWNDSRHWAYLLMSETTLSTLNGIYRRRIFRLTSTYLLTPWIVRKRKTLLQLFFSFFRALDFSKKQQDRKSKICSKYVAQYIEYPRDANLPRTRRGARKTEQNFWRASVSSRLVAVTEVNHGYPKFRLHKLSRKNSPSLPPSFSPVPSDPSPLTQLDVV